MAWENFDEERLKQIIRQFDGSISKKNKFLVKPSKIDCKLDEYDRVLVYDGNSLFAVPEKEIIDLGFN